jgi:hypothetical protein
LVLEALEKREQNLVNYIKYCTNFGNYSQLFIQFEWFISLFSFFSLFYFAIAFLIGSRLKTKQTGLQCLIFTI